MLGEIWSSLHSARRRRYEGGRSRERMCECSRRIGPEFEGMCLRSYPRRKVSWCRGAAEEGSS
jgi:hypothetical protein